MSTFVLVNPRSQSGATGHRLPELEALLRQHVGEYQVLTTEREGDGERLARLAAERGATRLVVAGGDGTVSEAVSGLVQCGRASDVEIGLLPLGTGRDFARLLKIGSDLAASVGRLVSGKRRRVDAGRIRCRGASGIERERCFLNIASMGLSAESTRWLAGRANRGPLSYLASALVGIARFPMPPVTLRVDDRIVHDGPLCLAAVSNGQYFGGGMRVAPDASIDDGLLDAVIVEGMSVSRALFTFPRLLIGRHVDQRRVRVHRGAKVHAESTAEVWIEADGEPVGTLPGIIEVLRGAVNLCGLP